MSQRNLENLYRVWLQATNMERGLGIVYYSVQRLKLVTIARTHSIDPVLAFGAFAALSPNNDEDGNYQDLLKVIEAFKFHRTPDDFRTNSYGPNKAKAIRIISGEEPLKVLGGPKVIAFYLNTLDPTDAGPVTVDGHMANVWAGQRRLLVRESGINERAYAEIAADVRAMARVVHILPNQLQSVLWLAWKRIHNIRYNPQFRLFDRF